jgi:hypothetical protein
MATNARQTTSSYSSSSIVCSFDLFLHYLYKILFFRRPDLLFDKTSSSSADLHEPGDDSIHNNFVLQPKTNSKQQLPLQLYL